jgi:hypothetical protein
VEVRPALHNDRSIELGRVFGHYTPQHYLRRFAIKDGKIFKTWRYDKATGGKINVNVKNVGGENDFYDFTDEDGKRVLLESRLSQLEGKYEAALKGFCANPSPANLKPYKKDLAHFISLQMVRTPTSRREIQDLYRTPARQLARFQSIELDESKLPSLTDDQLKSYHATQLEMAANYAKWFEVHLRWIIAYNKTGKPFWTSDCPVIKYNDDYRFGPNLGLASPSIQIITALTPEIVIINCDPSPGTYSHYREPTIHSEEGHVNFFNRQQVIHSKQYIFSIGDDFTVADVVIEENPIYSDPNHSRIVSYN